MWALRDGAGWVGARGCFKIMRGRGGGWWEGKAMSGSGGTTARVRDVASGAVEATLKGDGGGVSSPGGGVARRGGPGDQGVGAVDARRGRAATRRAGDSRLLLCLNE